jgi:NADPH2:quinone reductase
MEAAGVVVSAPADSGYAPGDAVCAFPGMGGYAERVAVPVASVLPSPPGLDHAEAVALLVNYYTMHFALVRRAAVRSGETVLVLGSAGGVGTAAIQVAKALGARVVAVVHRTGATDFVESLGADVVVPLAEGWSRAVRDAVGGVDIVVDPVGGDAFDEAVRTLAPEGRLLVIGFAAGGIPTVKVNRLLLRNAGVLGVGYGEFIRTNPDAQADVTAGLAALVADGLKPPPPQRYPLAEGRAALESLARGGVLGKVVLEPAG